MYLQSGVFTTTKQIAMDNPREPEDVPIISTASTHRVKEVIQNPFSTTRMEETVTDLDSREFIGLDDTEDIHTSLIATGFGKSPTLRK